MEEICFDLESVFLLIAFIFEQEKETIELQCMHKFFTHHGWRQHRIKARCYCIVKDIFKSYINKVYK